MEKTLYEWLVGLMVINFPISEKILQQKAKTFDNYLHVEDFIATAGFIGR